MFSRRPADRFHREALNDVAADSPRLTDSHTKGHTKARLRRTYLEGLARAIETSTDFRTQIDQASSTDALLLHVVNPISLSDDITCDLREGHWCYLWSWGDMIATTDDVEGAVKAIRHVLTPRM